MFYLVIIISILFSYIAQKKNKLFYLCVSIMVVSLFSGLRDVSVGIDTLNYYKIFFNIKRGIMSNNMELTFCIISKFFLYFLPNEMYLFLIYSIITNFCIIYRLWDFRYKASVPFMLFCYMVLYYPSTCNILRQYLAIAIVFFATKYLERKKYIRYIICVMIAALFHTTAMIAILYILIYAWTVEERALVKKNIAIITFTISPLIIWGVYKFSEKYNSYLSISNGRFGIMNLTKFLLVGYVFCRNLTLIKKKNLYYTEVDSENSLNYTSDLCIIIIYILSLILFSFGYYHTSIYRMGLYFGVFEMIYFARVVKSSNQKRKMEVLYGGVLAYYIYAGCISGWSSLATYQSWILK